MSNSSSSSDASTGDYRFWRSQHRPTAETGEDRDKKEIFYDAVCNRFGEEVGQRLDRLIWPRVPARVKHFAGVMGGLGGPLALACDALFTARNSAATRSTKNTLVGPALGHIRVYTDGKLITLDWNDLGILFERLSSTTKSWTILPLFSDSSIQFSVGEDPSAGTYERYGNCEIIEQRQDVSISQSVEYARGFLFDIVAEQIAKELEIDLTQPLCEVDKDTLARFVILTGCVAKLFEMETSPK